MNNQEEIRNAFKMMQIDLEQRSQHVIHLALDHSKFARISLLIWGAPLVIAATLLTTKLNTALFSEHISYIELIAISFFAASLINCILLCAMMGNRNSSRLAASAMNYLRRYYFKVIAENNLADLDDSVREALHLNKDNVLHFRIVKSRSADLGLILTAIANLAYAGFGAYLLYETSIILSAFLFLAILLAHLFVFRLMRIPGGRAK